MSLEKVFMKKLPIIVNTEGKSSQEVSSEIIKLVKNYG